MYVLKIFLMMKVNPVRKRPLISRVGSRGFSGTRMIVASFKGPEAKLIFPSTNIFNASRNVSWKAAVDNPSAIA